MRRWLLLFVCSGLSFLALPDRAVAQLECADPDRLALIFDNGDVNYSPQVGVHFHMYAVLLNPSVPYVKGFEFRVGVPGSDSSLIKLSEILPANYINIGDSSGENQWDYLVGIASPVPVDNSRVVLISYTLLATSNFGQSDFILKQVETPSIPNSLAYLDANNQIRPMMPVTEDFTSPAARLWPQTPLVFCQAEIDPVFTVTIGGEGENIVAGVEARATDGYDTGLDLADPTPKLTFPHQDWLGSPATNYERDLRATYDPTSTTKTWTFTAAPALAGSPDYRVDLTFTPSFTASAGIGLVLYDRATGSTIDLPNAGMQYSFVSSTPRTLDLTIGTIVTSVPELVIDISTTSGMYQDALTRAATDADATNGFDAGFDQPEPTPPPGNYLATSFEHADWPLGPRFSADVRAAFDPTTEAKIWPLIVETDQSGPVVLNFAPSFAAGDGIGLQLRDLQTGQIFNLFPALTYMYSNSSATVRRFELIVGASLPPELNPASRPLPSGWSMVGLPLAPPAGANTAGAVLIDPSPGYAYAFTYSRYSGYQSVAPTTGVAPGIGYWLGTSAAFNWTMSGTRSLDGVTVPLTNGWNLVGNANWFPGPFEGLRVIQNGTTYEWLNAVQAGLVSADVQSYSGASGTYFDAIDLQPWQAYWINALTNDLSLSFHWENFQQLPARLIAPPATAKSADNSWRTDLVLTDASAKMRAVTFGVEALATAGFDPLYDRPQPPASPDGGPSLSFQHPEWELAAGKAFTRDLVGPGESPVRWTVAMTAPTAGPATLSWDSSNWPEGVDYQLYFPHENRVVVMSMRRQTSLSVNVGPQPLNVVVRTPDMTSDVGDLPTGGAYSLSAQPNPFNPITTVSFDLPQAGRAEIRIYSLRGELVSVLGGQEYTAGRHQEVWNGRDRQGRDVPSGSYFGRLQVDGQVQGEVVRMSLVR